MFLEEIILDGFKSYAHRTCISGFDRSFNAITGLNGSGKSNILDAICFVLGITHLKEVRVDNMQELIYKQGTAGITKASVSITFNNTGGNSPVGYEQIPKITVTRQIAMGGRTKYLINGKTSLPSSVANMFHSVQLNVNNPHFLIKQGRITQVVKAKPAELLGLMEEAAGTRMFEVNKRNALKSIEGRGRKLQEIHRMISDAEEKMAKLEKERNDYEAFLGNQVEIEKLSRRVAVYGYVSRKTKGKETSERLQENTSRSGQLDSLLTSLASQEKEIDDYLVEMKEKLSRELKRETQDMERQEAETEKRLTAAQAAAKFAHEQLVAEVDKLKEMAASVTDLTNGIHSMEKDREKSQRAAGDAKELCEKQEEKCRNLRKKLELMQSGVAASEDGLSISEQIMVESKRASDSRAAAQKAQLRTAHVAAELKTLRATAGQRSDQAKSLAAERHHCQTSLDNLRAKRATMAFDADAYAAKEAQCVALRREVDGLQRDYDRLSAQLGNLTFDYTDPHRGFDRSAVKGMVATLFQLANKEHSTALEVSAGGKLYNIVVQTENIGRDLIDKGRLRRRVNIIPLNKVTGYVIPDHKRSEATRATQGKAHLALELIAYDDELTPAMKFVFGGTFICDNAQAAKTVTFGDLRAQSVTLDGDSFNPGGTLTGGSKGNLGKTLESVSLANEKRAELAAARERLARLERELGEQTQLRSEHQEATRRVEGAELQLQQLDARLQHTEQQRAAQGAARAEAELEALKAEVGVHRAVEQQAEEKIARLQKEEKAFQSVDKSKRNIENEKKAIQTAEASVLDLKKKCSEEQRNATAIATEMKELAKELERAARSEAEQQAAVTAAEVEWKRKTEVHTALQESAKTINEQLEGIRQEHRRNNAALERREAERDQIQRQAQQAAIEKKQLEHEQKDLRKTLDACEEGIRRILHDNEWIKKIENEIGRPGSEFEFNDKAAAASLERLEEMKEQQKKMQHNLNKKAVTMHESVQQEVIDLKKKEDQVNKDKHNIESMCLKLDAQKKVRLRETLEKVNGDFGEVFRTLLPGANARLDPVLDKDEELTGIEMRVAFGNAWKESLSETSGGQKSLLAVSFVLSLLRFNPAPVYILDEPDAALDLSHTENIGLLIKKKFSESQFLVVSLKEGMFNNANVLFRARCANGQSEVHRTSNQKDRREKRE